MNILVIGSGAREHAIVRECLRSELVDRVFCAPGNAGIAMVAKCVDIAVNDFYELADFAQEKLGREGLTIVGPEEPLAKGIVDYFESRGLLILGPVKNAARIEASKAFAKNLMQSHDIPTGGFAVFSSLKRAEQYICDNEPPFVIKRDELALGKGVVVAKTREEAYSTAYNFFLGRNSSRLILIEEFLEGWECSFTVLADGKNYMVLPQAIDYKTLNGKNTGGMGGFSSNGILSEEERRDICFSIIEPVLFHLQIDWESPFKGFLYAGLMMTKDGPKALEFNARLGDPEAQTILPRISNTDFVEMCLRSAQGRLKEVIAKYGFIAEESEEVLVDVVMASPGYPDNPEIGFEIFGLEDATREGVIVLHAGTRLRGSKIVTSGGRVLSVIGQGRTLEDAREVAYRAVRQISFGDPGYGKSLEAYREDIGL